MFEAGESQGKSGSFFFYSHDKRFILKTLLVDEKATLLRMLDAYIFHIVNSKNKSLLVRIYGLFTIKSNYFSNLDVILMENISRNFEIDNVRLFTFDLKGSQINRREILEKGKILKDLNFIEINRSKKKLVRLNKEDADKLFPII
jgi:1-phosphatidylinositol-4-phosphate 5-kinase